MSEIFVLIGWSDHELPALKIPHRCEVEGHVGEDHKILEQSKKCITCEDKKVRWWTIQQKNSSFDKKGDINDKILTPRLTVHVVFPVE